VQRLAFRAKISGHGHLSLAASLQQFSERSLIVDRAQSLSNVVWIGGGSGAGKSTIARFLQRRGYELYDTDLMMSEHAEKLSSREAPLLAQFKSMDMDQRWLLRTPQEMYRTFHWFWGEGFELIVEDLLARHAEVPTVAEGFRLLPRLVAPLLQRRESAVWLIPTPEFRRRAFETRGSLWSIAERTSDPPKALFNLLERDRIFTERIALEAREHGLAVVEVDHAKSESALIDEIVQMLSPS
jgi:2-phosphoglycerate kinase